MQVFAIPDNYKQPRMELIYKGFQNRWGLAHSMFGDNVPDPVRLAAIKLFLELLPHFNKVIPA